MLDIIYPFYVWRMDLSARLFGNLWSGISSREWVFVASTPLYIIYYLSIVPFYSIFIHLQLGHMIFAFAAACRGIHATRPAGTLTFSRRLVPSSLSCLVHVHTSSSHNRKH